MFSVVSCGLVDRYFLATKTIHELTPNSTIQLNHVSAPLRLRVSALQQMKNEN
jgi:hypothetical protein